MMRCEMVGLALLLPALLAACGADGSDDVGAASAAASAPAQGGNALLVAPAASASGPDALLVIFPGAKIPAEQYTKLAAAVQAAAGGRLWVGIPSFMADMANPLQAGARFDEVVKAAREAGAKDLELGRDVFVAGHSLGGIMAKDVVKGRGLAGLVLLASYLPALPFSPDLAAYPVPVLTLGGEIDGQARITRIAKELAALEALLAGGGAAAANALADKPVVVLPDVNHRQFAAGVPDPADHDAEIPLDEAHARIATVVGAFLNAHRRADAATVTAARTTLASAVTTTRGLLDGYLALVAREGGSYCEGMQRRIAGLPAAEESALAITSQRYGDAATFALSKPSLEAENGGLQVGVRTMTFHLPNPGDAMTSVPNAAVAIACKTKSPAALAEAQPALSIPAGTPSCAAENAHALELALAAVRPEARARYLAKGRSLRFLDDQALGTGVQWLAAPLSFEASKGNGEVFEVRSPRLLTAPDATPPFEGMFYCKLVSPARAAEWVLFDAFER
jgi:hypothetical protein